MQWKRSRKIRRIQPGGLDRLKCDPDPPVKHEKDFTEGGPKFRRLASPTLWSAPWPRRLSSHESLNLGRVEEVDEEALASPHPGPIPPGPPRLHAAPTVHRTWMGPMLACASGGPRAG